jgi:autotransporter-associated beta strand protein
LNVDGTQLTLSGVISDGANDYDIEKTGSGILVLSGTNTFSGTTTISGGTLSIAADAGLGTAPGSAVAAQLTLNGGTLAATETFTLNANRGITLGSSHGTINVANTKTLTILGVISGVGNLTISGLGNVILSGTKSYLGNTILDNGNIIVNKNDALGANPTIISNGGSLSINTNIVLPSLTINGDTDLIIKSDIITTGAQTYNAPIIVNSVSNSRVVTVANDGFVLNTYSQEIIPEGQENAGNGEISDDPDTDGKDWKIFRTDNADITFNSTLKSNGISPNPEKEIFGVENSLYHKTSLALRTCLIDECTGGNITFNGKVGFAFIDNDMDADPTVREERGQYEDAKSSYDNLYRLDVNAQTIYIYENIMTWEEQNYLAPVLVGSNNDQKVKFAISVDPKITFLSTIGDVNNNGTHTLVARAVRTDRNDPAPLINFKVSNIDNFDFRHSPLDLIGDQSTTNIGVIGEGVAVYAGRSAGIALTGVTLPSILNITYTAPTISSSDRSANIIKALTSAGNSGSILDFFKNLGRTSEGSSRVYSKSIEVFTGADARRGMPASSSSAPAQERKPETSKQGQENSTSTNQSQDSNSSSEGEGGDDSQGAQCAEGQENSAECKNI